MERSGKKPLEVEIERKGVSKVQKHERRNEERESDNQNIKNNKNRTKAFLKKTINATEL